MYSFAFKWSYQNRAGYQFSDGEIETHRELGWMETYRRQLFNGDDDAFKRNVLDAIGGAQVHWTNRSGDAWRRWTPELYAAFVADVKRSHAESIAYAQALAAKHPDVDWSEALNRPLVVPRPIYWNDDAARFEVEPFYKGGETIE
jgi:hypothetical protein